MPPRPRHKRSAGSGGDVPSQHTAKKTRFVEPEDDPANFAEQVDSQLEDGGRRKGRVKTEGYDSDSSDDGEGVVLSRKAGADGAGEEEDDDMFAMGDKEEKKGEEAAGKGKKKKDEYLRLGDIEGQEFGREAGSDDESEEDEEEDQEPEDEDEAERQKKVGMGFELSAFNMREEMEEGKFSADGMYVRTFDPHAVHDRWMEGMDDKEIKKARKSRKQQERIQKEKMKAEEREMEQLGGKDEMEKALLGLLKKGETVLEALQRLGAKAKKDGGVKKQLKPNNKTKRSGTDGAMDVDKPPTTKAPPVLTDIDHITHLASTLMSFGDTDIYSKTYEELVRAVRATGKVDEGWVPPSADVRYEYKWDVPGATAEDGEVFGPFSEEEMQTWYSASYFGSGGEKIKVRVVGGEWGGWDEVV